MQTRSEFALSLVDRLDAMVAYWDRDQICRFANRAYRDWFGHEPHELIGMHMNTLLGPIYEKNLPYIRAAYEGRKQVFRRTIQTPSGQVRQALATYIPHVEDGRVQGIFVHVADVDALSTSDTDGVKSNVGPYSVDVENRRVLMNSTPVELTHREFALAMYFFARPGAAISRAELCSQALAINARIVTRTLDTHVSRLRRKLELDGRHGVALVGLYQFGYRLQGK